MPDNELAKKVFLELVQLNHQGFTTWATAVLKLASDLNLDITDIDNKFANDCKKAIRNRFISSWFANLHNIQANPILRTYMRFKSDFVIEPYLYRVKKLRYSEAISKFRCSSHTLSWFENYLSNRKQYVTYNGIVSKTEKNNCGAPQGSILGPLLFLLYINDLSTVSKACMSILFADDTNMFFTGKNLQTMTRVINEELTKVQEWLYCNKLSLIVLKTHYMIFTSRNKCMNDVDIRINNVKIERVYATKFLGVQIDAQLTWKKHIEYTCNKLCKCVGILAKARKKLHTSSLLTLYYSFAFPYFIYCNHVWGNTYQTKLKSLVLVKKMLIRIISCAPFKAHTEPLMFARRILSVTDINLYMSGIFMYQCLYCSIPRLFDDFFQRNNDVHGHNTRQANDLHVPYARLDIRKFCFKVHGANIWNSTSILIRQSPSLDVFKQRLRPHLIESKSIVHPAVNWTVPMNETITYYPTPYDDIEKAYNTFIFYFYFFIPMCVFCLFVFLVLNNVFFSQVGSYVLYD